MAWTYASKETVAALQQIPVSGLEDEWSTWIEALIAQRLGTVTIGTTTTVTEERHDGDGTPYLYVDKPPIVSVTEIKTGYTTLAILASTAYAVYDTRVILHNDNIFTVGRRNVYITYVSGETSVPPIVEFCAARMIGEIYKFSNRGGADSSVKYSPPSREEGESPTQKTRHGLEGALLKIMDNMLGRGRIKLG